MDCGLLNASSKLAANSVLARFTSSAVGGASANPCSVANTAASASANESPLRTSVLTSITPGSPSCSVNTDEDAAKPGSTTFW